MGEEPNRTPLTGVGCASWTKVRVRHVSLVAFESGEQFDRRTSKGPADGTGHFVHKRALQVLSVALDRRREKRGDSGTDEHEHGEADRMPPTQFRFVAHAVILPGCSAIDDQLFNRRPTQRSGVRIAYEMDAICRISRATLIHTRRSRTESAATHLADCTRATRKPNTSFRKSGVDPPRNADLESQ
jgi:hypothetical protein